MHIFVSVHVRLWLDVGVCCLCGSHECLFVMSTCERFIAPMCVDTGAPQDNSRSTITLRNILYQLIIPTEHKSSAFISLKSEAVWVYI